MRSSHSVRFPRKDRPMKRRLAVLPILCLGLLAAGLALPIKGETSKSKTTEKADKKSSASSKDSAVKGTVHKVEKEPFKVEVTLKGVFETERMTDVAIRPEVWMPDSRGLIVVRKAIEHGSHVKKGDTLIWPDLDKIDQAIHDAESD